MHGHEQQKEENPHLFDLGVQQSCCYIELSHTLMQDKSYLTENKEKWFNNRRFELFRSTAGLFGLALQEVLVSKIAYMSVQDLELFLPVM